MRKVYQLGLIAFSNLLLASCVEGKIKSFVDDFFTAVKNNDTASIAKMYPDAVSADSLLCEYDADIQIEEMDNCYKVILGEGKDFVLSKDKKNDVFYVKESHGVFCFPPGKKELSYRLGLINNQMNDAAIKVQLADSAFFAFVVNKFISEFINKFRISQITADCTEYDGDVTVKGEWYITLKNDCDYDIDGSDYQVILTSMLQRNKKVIVPGELAFSKSSVELRSGYQDPSFYVNYYENRQPKIELKYTRSPIELFEKYYRPTGNEYNEYINQNKK